MPPHARVRISESHRAALLVTDGRRRTEKRAASMIVRRYRQLPDDLERIRNELEALRLADRGERPMNIVFGVPEVALADRNPRTGHKGFRQEPPMGGRNGRVDPFLPRPDHRGQKRVRRPG